MRPIALAQPFVRFPISHVLATEANVRSLRVLAGVDGPLCATDIAARAGLSLPGARKTLERLTRTGIVVPVGSGRRQQYALRPSDPLADSLRQMFRTEHERHEMLLDRLRDAVQQLVPPPRSVWIEGGGDTPGEPLHLGLLHHTKWLSESARSLRQHLVEIEREFDLTIELAGYSSADLRDTAVQQQALLFGVPVAVHDSTVSSSVGHSHRDLDDRSAAWAEALAEFVRQDPSLVDRARRHVERLLNTDTGTAVHDLREWKDILESYSTARLLRFVTANTPRAQRLRQSSPLVAVLDDEQRQQLRRLLHGSRE